MTPGAIQRRLEGRRCDALVVYEAHDAAGLVDGVAMLVLGLDLDQRGAEWARGSSTPVAGPGRPPLRSRLSPRMAKAKSGS